MPSAVAAASAALKPILVEVLTVAGGLRSAGRHTTTLSAVLELRDELLSMDFAAAIHRPSKDRWGYGYLAPEEQAELAAGERCQLLYAKDRETLHELIAAHESGDDERIGYLLGYPACCVRANTIYGGIPINDYVRTARVSGSANWRLNPYLSSIESPDGTPYSLISHFPCSLECAASIEQANRRKALLEGAAPALAQSLEHWLPMPLLLYDDTGLEADRRTGLAGAVLFGISNEQSVAFSGWRPLRRRRHVASLPLDRCNCARRTAEGVELSGSPDDAGVQLPGDRWLLITFSEDGSACRS